ncbi:MAG: zinc ABC transporter substrate-binding protein [Erysipelotrichaceae bacterium]|nr:zinc ABC transporter substrate-binding protein [Erysipelotrichaceae bacterium]
MKILKKALITILLLLLLTGCSQVKTYTAYTVYPVGYLLNRIGGNRINTISVQDNSIVERAKPIDNFKEVIDDSFYFFHIGDLEPYLEIYNDDILDSGVNSIDLSLLNSIYKFQRYTRVSSGGVETYIESPYYDGECFDSIDTYDFDLFLWLDPSGMLSMAKDVYDTLSNNFVEQSQFFKDNYNTLYTELTTLEASYHQLSNKLKSENKVVKFVCMTPSFGAWQKSYGFSVYPICLSKYGTLPTDEQLAIIKQRIIDDDVKYIAYEPNMTEEMTSLFSSLEQELGLKRVNLSNLSSLTTTQSEENKDYFTIMYENLSVLENIAVSVTTVTEEVKEVEVDE